MGALAVLAVSVACDHPPLDVPASPPASSSSPSPPSSRLSSASASGGGGAVSVAMAYSSLAALARDSTAVVVATVSPGAHATPADQAGASPLRATISDLVVQELLGGDLDGASAIELRQLGTSGMNSESFTPVLTAGQSYVLFLKPFTFGAGADPTGEYVITGDQGAYEAVGGSYHRISPGGRELPADVSMSQIRSALR